MRRNQEQAVIYIFKSFISEVARRHPHVSRRCVTSQKSSLLSSPLTLIPRSAPPPLLLLPLLLRRCRRSLCASLISPSDTATGLQRDSSERGGGGEEDGEIAEGRKKDDPEIRQEVKRRLFFLKSPVYFFGLITPPLCSHLSLPPFCSF